MQRKWAGLITLGSLFCAVVLCFAQSYTLSTGETITGEPFHFDANGIVFKYPDGRTSARVPWTNFPEAVLKQLAANPKAKPFVGQYLDTGEDEGPKKPEIKVKQPTRLERPATNSAFTALFSSPLSIVLLALVYLANIYAGLEIASFRNYPRGLVCGLAAVVPFVAPVIFLCLPTSPKDWGQHAEAPATAEEAPPPTAPQQHRPPSAPIPAYSAGAQATQTAESPPAEPEPEAAPPPRRPAPAAPRLPAPVVYQRGQTMFNRRFFETKLAGFLRMVPSDAEKDMLVIVKSSRGEFVGHRISKLQPSDLVLQYRKGDATSEITVPYTEINEIQVRHKDA